MKNYKTILIAFLAGVVIFAGFKYVSLVREKYILEQNVNLINKQIDELIATNADLKKEVEAGKEFSRKLEIQNTALKTDLAAAEESLNQMQQQLSKTEDSLNRMGERFSLLKEENRALINRNTALKENLNRSVKESDTLRARLTSKVELKKALRELKHQARKVVTVVKKKITPKPPTEGNRGYIIRDGRIMRPTVRIEVSPAPDNP